ncbi:MAG: phenylacetate--CoA ligase, partial [Acidobacteriota bacterium]
MEISYFNRDIETASREDLDAHQLSRLQGLVKTLLASNPFYGVRLRDSGITDARMVKSLEDFKFLPFTI